MTATDTIRAMLDKRGVECWDMKTRGVWFGISGREHRFEAYEQTDGLIALNIYDLTPEQAIEATLGRGECQLKRASWDDGTCTWGCICSACDAHLEHDTGIGYNYCPNCGRKVRA